MLKSTSGRWTAFVSILSLLLSGSLSAQSSTYYIDSEHGTDSNNGLEVGSAWKSLSRINSTNFQPGDTIYFRAGSSWNGMLMPKGNGGVNKPIVINSYGRGRKPRIIGDGGVAAVMLRNQDWWEISNLDVSNDAPEEGLRRGILILAEDAGRVLCHIVLRRLDVHNVRGKLGEDVVSKTTGGIAFEVRGTKSATRFEDILVEHCTVMHTDNTGIYTWTDFRPHPRDPRWQELRFTGVKIRNNRLEDIGKNAMGIRSSLAPLIENNVVVNAAARFHGNAIYVFGCKDAVIQSNEVCGTKYYGLEGAAVDSDYNSEGTVIQYNYSHSNGGGMVNLCNNPQSPPPRGYNDGTIVRFNISQNDIHRVIAFDGPVTNTQIYNNTIFVGDTLAPKIIEFDIFGKAPGYAKRTWFRNNIVFSLGRSTYVWGESEGNVFEYNCFYGNHPESEPEDSWKNTSDPLFVDPGKASHGRHSTGGYKLQPDSPCIDSGMLIENNGGLDYWQNRLTKDKQDRGACKF